jgi:hypothetical protein
VIAPPRRSVTRFFIPLIDVLILLFCIFLLMPFVSTPGEPAPPPEPTPAAEELQRLKDDLANTRRMLELARKARANIADNLAPAVLEIDAATGKLFSPDPAAVGGRAEIADAGAARRFVDRAKTRANGKDVLVLILYPRQLTGFPVKAQTDAYRQWFAGVPVTFDNPWAGP